MPHPSTCDGRIRVTCRQEHAVLERSPAVMFRFPEFLKRTVRRPERPSEPTAGSLTSRPSEFKISGACDICEAPVTFVAKGNWLRDQFLCSGCGSIPRERALMRAIKVFYPNFRDLDIHESSPAGRGASTRLARDCPRYSYSHYFPSTALGDIDDRTGARCESLEQLTFPDGSFDLFVTQDVLEHIFDVDATFREIARVLRPGGAHIFSVPLVNKANPSQPRATRLKGGSIVHHVEPEYHGNPVDPNG